MSDLILPSAAVRPTYGCLCGKQFYSVSAGQRHAARCSVADEMVTHHVEQQKQDKDSSAFSRPTDPEAREWIDRRLSEGKRGTKNGRPA